MRYLATYCRLFFIAHLPLVLPKGRVRCDDLVCVAWLLYASRDLGMLRSDISHVICLTDGTFAIREIAVSCQNDLRAVALLHLCHKH